MNVVFMGTPKFSVPILRKLAESYNVLLVVSQPNKVQGRKGLVIDTPIKALADELGIECFQPINIKEDYQKIIDCNPDIIITAAYGQMIPDEVLNYPRLGSINVHASLLPKLRGGAPIHKAITRGYKETGITIMYMVSKMDAGDIIKQAKTPINDDDNQETLHDRLSDMGATLLLETLPLIESGNINPIKQDESLATYASNVSKEMEHIKFSKSTRQVFNLIRGLSPVPGAYGIINGIKVKFFSSRILNDKPHEEGIILENKKRLVIGLKDGELEILELQVEGKKRINAKDYLNGQKLFNIGDILS